jgi:hypothetical protein
VSPWVLPVWHENYSYKKPKKRSRNCGQWMTIWRNIMKILIWRITNWHGNMRNHSR